MTLSPAGGTGAVTISATAGAGGVSQIVAGSGIAVTPAGGTGTVTIDATGVPGPALDPPLGATIVGVEDAGSTIITWNTTLPGQVVAGVRAYQFSSESGTAGYSFSNYSYGGSWKALTVSTDVANTALNYDFLLGAFVRIA